jgi:hypothetical protein
LSADGGSGRSRRMSKVPPILDQARQVVEEWLREEYNGFAIDSEFAAKLIARLTPIHPPLRHCPRVHSRGRCRAHAMSEKMAHAMTDDAQFRQDVWNLAKAFAELTTLTSGEMRVKCEEVMSHLGVRILLRRHWPCSSAVEHVLREARLLCSFCGDVTSYDRKALCKALSLVPEEPTP